MADTIDPSERSAPLTESDLDDINRSLQRLDDASVIMDRARQAGIDVTAFEQRQRDARDKLLKLKQAFFPGR